MNWASFGVMQWYCGLLCEFTSTNHINIIYSLQSWRKKRKQVISICCNFVSFWIDRIKAKLTFDIYTDLYIPTHGKSFSDLLLRLRPLASSTSFYGPLFYLSLIWFPSPHFPPSQFPRKPPFFGLPFILTLPILYKNCFTSTECDQSIALSQLKSLVCWIINFIGLSSWTTDNFQFVCFIIIGLWLTLGISS